MYLCDRKCENSIYVLMHRTSQIKHCKNPMDSQIRALMEGQLPNSPSFGHIAFPPKQQQNGKFWAYHGDKQDTFNSIPFHFLPSNVSFKSFLAILKAYGLDQQTPKGEIGLEDHKLEFKIIKVKLQQHKSNSR